MFHGTAICPAAVGTDGGADGDVPAVAEVNALLLWLPSILVSFIRFDNAACCAGVGEGFGHAGLGWGASFSAASNASSSDFVRGAQPEAESDFTPIGASRAAGVTPTGWEGVGPAGGIFAGGAFVGSGATAPPTATDPGVATAGAGDISDPAVTFTTEAVEAAVRGSAAQDPIRASRAFASNEAAAIAPVAGDGGKG